MIREAQTKDMPILIKMMTDMVAHIRGCCEYDRFATDENQLVGGLMIFIAAKMQDPGSIVLVMESEQDHNVCGFLVGQIMVVEPFMKDVVLGDVQSLYPIAFGITEPLSLKFDEWAKSKGATARIGRAELGNDVVGRVYQKRNRMNPVFIEYALPYEKDQ